MPAPLRRAPVAVALLVLLAAALALVIGHARSGDDARAEACPPGYLTSEEHEVLERAEQRYERDHGLEREEGEERERAREERTREVEGACYSRSHPESAGEFLAAKSFSEARSLAPRTTADPRAWGRAVQAYARAAQNGSASDVAGSAGTWSPVGHGPLMSGEPGYEEARFGLRKLNGRVADFSYDSAGKKLYAAVANGGVWVSDNLGTSWSDVSGNLPTMIVGSVTWVPGKGSRPGSILALTGDNAFGGYTYPGAGAYRSTDGGKTWARAKGVPDGALGFKAAVDPSNADNVWLATGLGLYRSTDGGASFDQVSLPTGPCSGQSLTKKGCFLANVVTDVVVQKKDATHPGGRVLAAVGYRAGTRKNPDGTVQSTGNGIYTNTADKPTTFTRVDGDGFAVPQNPDASRQDSIGRIELGIANGEGQNPDYVYAVVQDAFLFNHNGIHGIDVPDIRDPVVGANPLGKRTVLNGIYVTNDFGSNWSLMANGDELQGPGKNSALVGVYNAAAGYGPGIQSWYDQFISVDPTRQQGGVPTRITFGLEEVWQNSSALAPGPGTPQDGKSDFSVIGRYFSGETCQGGIVTPPAAANICPTSNPPVQGTTTHPDQHAGLTLPDGNGGAVLIVGNDGGAFVQKVGANQPMSNDGWGEGANDGFYTLLPYDAHMAKDGTTYAGLQDNGGMKIQPDGKQVAIQGGDGFFTAVDPDNSKVAYGEVTGGTMYRTTDAGLTSEFIDPELTQGSFVTPFVMDPADAKHLLVAGRDVKESVFGPDTQSPSAGADTSWQKVYDLGTRKHRGDGAAEAAADDPNNSASAIAMRGLPAGPVPSGSKSADQTWSGGAGTVPGGGSGLEASNDDHEVVVKPGEANGSMTISITWANPVDDWDLTVLRKGAGGKLEEVGRSANGPPSDTESVTVTNPAPGTYVARAENYAATVPQYDGSAKFTAPDPNAKRHAAYIGFCGFCDPLTEGAPFDSGIATNVGGDGLGGVRMSSDGWHIAKADGLPKRTITGIAIAPDDAKTIYVTVGGYQVRPFVPPGALGEDISGLGKGHLFVSNDAGESFRDISGDLPDIPATAILLHDGQPVVATNVGVYIGEDLKGGHFAPLGSGLPPAPVFNLSSKAGDDDLLIASSYGRGVQQYRYKDPSGVAGGAGGGAPSSACVASAQFRSAGVKPRGRKVRLAFQRRVKRPVKVDVFQVSHGRRVIRERLIARFRHRAKSFTWNGRATRKGRRATDGVYFVRYQMGRKGQKSSEFRRLVLERRHGKWRKRPDYYRRATCDPLFAYKLTRPVFGGRQRTSLGISWRLLQTARVGVVVKRGKRVVARYKTRTQKGQSRSSKRYRWTLPARKLARRGNYRVTITVRRGQRTIRSTLTSRRL